MNKFTKYAAIHFAVDHLYINNVNTSILYIYGDILTKNVERKKKEQYKEAKKSWMALSIPQYNESASTL